MKVPLHPGTNLANRDSLQLAWDSWLRASSLQRDIIVMNILYEIETFGECYQQGVDIESSDSSLDFL